MRNFNIDDICCCIVMCMYSIFIGHRWQCRMVTCERRSLV